MLSRNLAYTDYILARRQKLEDYLKTFEPLFTQFLGKLISIQVASFKESSGQPLCQEGYWFYRFSIKHESQELVWFYLAFQLTPEKIAHNYQLRNMRTENHRQNGLKLFQAIVLII
jgi:hypothetical protein